MAAARKHGSTAHGRADERAGSRSPAVGDCALFALLQATATEPLISDDERLTGPDQMLYVRMLAGLEMWCEGVV
jgi:hypothetical protein